MEEDPKRELHSKKPRSGRSSKRAVWGTGSDRSHKQSLLERRRNHAQIERGSFFGKGGEKKKKARRKKISRESKAKREGKRRWKVRVKGQRRKKSEGWKAKRERKSTKKRVQGGGEMGVDERVWWGTDRGSRGKWEINDRNLGGKY